MYRLMMASRAETCSDALQPNELRYAQWNVSELFCVLFLLCLTGKTKTHIYLVLRVKLRALFKNRGVTAMRE
jgi:hypothetical protein